MKLKANRLCGRVVCTHGLAYRPLPPPLSLLPQALYHFLIHIPPFHLLFAA